MTVRTVTLPIVVGASWDDFAWPSKAPGDDLPYLLDCARWLADGGLTLVRADVSSSPGLLIDAEKYVLASNLTTGVQLQIGGGTPSTTAYVAIVLTLDSPAGPSTLTVQIALQIRAAAMLDLVPTFLAGLISDGSGGALSDGYGQYLVDAYTTLDLVTPISAGLISDGSGPALSDGYGQYLFAA